MLALGIGLSLALMDHPSLPKALTPNGLAARQQLAAGPPDASERRWPTTEEIERWKRLQKLTGPGGPEGLRFRTQRGIILFDIRKLSIQHKHFSKFRSENRPALTDADPEKRKTALARDRAAQKLLDELDAKMEVLRQELEALPEPE